MANRGGAGIPKAEGESRPGVVGGRQIGEVLDCQTAESGLDSLGPWEPLKVIGAMARLE